MAASMRNALTSDSACRGAVWSTGRGAIGAVDLVTPVPATLSSNGRLYLWAVGEVFSGLAGGEVAGHLQCATVRRALLREVDRRGPQALADVNGEFQIAIWDEVEQSLLLAGDRFGSLPLYWVLTPQALAFAGTVAALLQAPGVSSDPDENAIREAVTFGGFRLGDRTNIRGVHMLGGARTLLFRGGDTTVRRYWNWPAAPEPTGRPLADLIEESHARWQTAVRRRLRDAVRPGTTLSGGLDSRAVMAEATSQGASFTALTYGLPRCDDARFAKRAAAAAHVEWTFAPLYDGDWLERRTRLIPATDGLVQLADLMHFETFDRQTSLMDVNVSGYIGDVVCGDTYGNVRDTASLLRWLPYSGVSLAWTLQQAHEWAEAELAALAPGDGRFAIFEHKFPQAIHRIFQALQSRIRVRRPFIDHDVFDFYAGLDAPTRAVVYHGMLKSRYPALFARIPYQKTNAPVLTRPADVQLRRIARFAGRRVRDVMARTGLVRPAPSRSYHDEERYWREPQVRARIVGTILRRGSISAEIFGRSALASFVDEWFTSFNGPAQSVGALYVFEHYHQTLAARPRQHIASAAV